MRGTGKACSWAGTPASKKAKDEPASKAAKEESCAVEEGNSTPKVVRELRANVLRYKREQQERRRNCVPDPQRVAAAATANHHRTAAKTTSASIAAPSEVALADITSTARKHQAANQVAMQRNRLINVVAAGAVVANNVKPPVKPRHVTFAPGVKPPHDPQPKPKPKKKLRSPPLPPPPPPPTPSQQRQLTATASAPRHIGVDIGDMSRSPLWTKSHRCVYRKPDCQLCIDMNSDICCRSCAGVSAWCGGDKRFLPTCVGRTGALMVEKVSQFWSSTWRRLRKIVPRSELDIWRCAS